MWKDWILSLFTLRIVHVSEPYNTTDNDQQITNLEKRQYNETEKYKL